MEIDIFDRNNIELYYNDIYVLDLMNRFFKRLPDGYRVNYDNNLQNLTLISPLINNFTFKFQQNQQKFLSF